MRPYVTLTSNEAVRYGQDADVGCDRTDYEGEEEDNGSGHRHYPHAPRVDQSTGERPYSRTSHATLYLDC